MTDVDFLSMRKDMVDKQIIARGIKDSRVITAFTKVPRHKFLPGPDTSCAYDDCPLPIGEEQTISQPYIVALMTQCLSLSGIERVLEIGTGSGYQAAILAELSREVYTIERLPSLAGQAEKVLRNLGYKNIWIKLADGTLGWQENSPYDRIIVTASSASVPAPLLKQLKADGKLIIPLGEWPSQILTLIEKVKDKIETRQVCGCVFVPLIGEHGWKEDKN